MEYMTIRAFSGHPFYEPRYTRHVWCPWEYDDRIEFLSLRVNPCSKASGTLRGTKWFRASTLQSWCSIESSSHQYRHVYPIADLLKQRRNLVGLEITRWSVLITSEVLAESLFENCGLLVRENHRTQMLHSLHRQVWMPLPRKPVESSPRWEGDWGPSTDITDSFFRRLASIVVEKPLKRSIQGDERYQSRKSALEIYSSLCI
jgi:hypothetical protein